MFEQEDLYRGFYQHRLLHRRLRRLLIARKF
jgi:hypothetical protein